MDLQTFERRALRYWQRIPLAFREGVTALVIEPGTFRKDAFEDGWVYGTCAPDEAVMAIPDAPIASIITLYYGSFVAIAADEPDFDWEAELWETLRHELQHHLEWRSGVDHLGVEDDVQDENGLRVQGDPFTPWFHRAGTPLGPGAWLADDDLFLEVAVAKAAWASLADRGLRHPWGDLVFRADPVPQDLLAHEPLYLPAEPVMIDAEVSLPWRDAVLVVWRERGWFDWLLR